MSLKKGSVEPKVLGMSTSARQVSNILGIKTRPASTAGLAAAVHAGLPKAALQRVVERAGFRGADGAALMNRVVPAATFKRRQKLKPAESERTERLARVVALAELLWDEGEAARQFLHDAHPELGGQRPIDAALTELGARQVEEVVMRALHGLPV
jgi:putative toxin-antitoxin system antitoxin component (TIGR02293 family)